MWTMICNHTLTAALQRSTAIISDQMSCSGGPSVWAVRHAHRVSASSIRNIITFSSLQLMSLTNPH